MDEPRECRHCGQPIIARTKRAVYCSRACKENFHAAKAKAASAERRAGRNCVMCGGPIESRSRKARTCSKPCAIRFQNVRRQQERREKWEAVKPPCAGCGGEIPSSRRINVLYCSPECKKKEQDRRWREKAPGYMRQYLYGITPEEYDQLLEAQDGRCAICGADKPDGKGGWHVDHNHDTGEVRGLLCTRCNLMLGHAQDDRVRLEKAVRYLS